MNFQRSGGNTQRCKQSLLTPRLALIAQTRGADDGLKLAGSLIEIIVNYNVVELRGMDYLSSCPLQTTRDDFRRIRAAADETLLQCCLQ